MYVPTYTLRRFLTVKSTADVRLSRNRHWRLRKQKKLRRPFIQWQRSSREGRQNLNRIILTIINESLMYSRIKYGSVWNALKSSKGFYDFLLLHEVYYLKNIYVQWIITETIMYMHTGSMKITVFNFFYCTASYDFLNFYTLNMIGVDIKDTFLVF